MTDTTPIIFMHMMKTGGLTMVNILREAFGVDHTFKLGNTSGDNITYLPHLVAAARNPEMHVFIGHFGWGIQNLFDRPVLFTTILRHPIERVLSLCQYLGVSISDPDILSGSIAALPEARNGMVRRLNGLTSVAVSEGTASNVSWPDLSPADIHIPLTNIHLEAARQALKVFRAIGVQEKFPETLLLFRDRLGSPPLFNINRPFVNNSSHALTRDNVVPSAIGIIQEHNQLDLELYEQCRKNFDHQIIELEMRRSVEMTVQRLLNDGLAERGKQMLEEDEAFAKLQSMINGLIHSEKLEEAACMLCYILSKSLDRDTAGTCLDLLRKIGSAEDINREEIAFKRQFG